MKSTPSGWLLKGFYAVLMLFSALLAGCAANRQDAGNFNNIAGRLEAGGTVYGIFGASASMPQMLDEYIRQLDVALASADMPEEEQDAVRKNIAAARMFWHLSGLNNCSGVGLSSVRDASGIFSNRVFVALDKNDAGAAEKIIGDGGNELENIIAGLPAETFNVVGGKLSLYSAFEIVRGSGCLGGALQKYLPPGFPMEIFNCMDGWWIAAAARNPALSPQENSVMLRVPDKDGKLFNLAKMLLNFKQKLPENNNRVMLPFKDKVAGWAAPVMKSGDGVIYLYNDERAEKLFETLPGGALKDDKVFKCYSNGIKLDGELFAFSRKMNSVGNLALTVPVAGVQMALESRSCFGVLSRESAGWLWQEKSDVDLSGGICEFLVLPRFGKYLLPRRVKKKKSAEVSKNAVKKVVSVDFTSRLKKLHEQLLKFSGSNNGKFPEFTGTDSLKKAMPEYRRQRNIFYFGGEKGKKDLPLAIAFSKNAGNVFYVLYADGEVKKYNLERSGSCRRIISFLYTVHRWEAELFQRLIEKAQILDGQSAQKE